MTGSSKYGVVQPLITYKYGKEFLSRNCEGKIDDRKKMETLIEVE
jgi:hypothetical protein